MPSPARPRINFSASTWREIIGSNVEINKLPKRKPSIIGTFRLRDQIHPLIDLPVALGFADRISPPNPETERVIIVAEFNERMMGFLVRNVERIFSFSADEMEKPPVGDEKMDYIVFYAMLDAGRYLFVLDFERIGGETGHYRSNGAGRFNRLQIPRTQGHPPGRG